MRRCPQGTGSGDRTLRRQRQPRFLFSQCALFRGGGRAWILPYLDDSYLSDYAIRAPISTPGTEPVLLAEARKEGLAAERKRALAYAFAEKRMTQAEPLLLGWARRRRRPDGRTDLQCAGCLRFARFAQTAGRRSRRGRRHGWDNTGAADAHSRLPVNLVAAGDAQPAVKAAKGLLKCDRQYVRGAALAGVCRCARHRKGDAYVLAAVKEGPAEYRYAALQTSSARATTRSLRGLPPACRAMTPKPGPRC